jgi:hypothetical protein
MKTFLAFFLFTLVSTSFSIDFPFLHRFQNEEKKVTIRQAEAEAFKIHQENSQNLWNEDGNSLFALVRAPDDKANLFYHHFLRQLVALNPDPSYVEKVTKIQVFLADPTLLLLYREFVVAGANKRIHYIHQKGTVDEKEKMKTTLRSYAHAGYYHLEIFSKYLEWLRDTFPDKQIWTLGEHIENFDKYLTDKWDIHFFIQNHISPNRGELLKATASGHRFFPQIHPSREAILWSCSTALSLASLAGGYYWWNSRVPVENRNPAIQKVIEKSDDSSVSEKKPSSVLEKAGGNFGKKVFGN